MKPITERANDMKLTDDFDWEITTPSIDEHDAPDEVVDADEVLNKVWEVYGGFTATRLSKMTHMPGTPWDQIYKKHSGHLPDRALIPNDMIREYFANVAARKAAER